jgi:hypothetical protein
MKKYFAVLALAFCSVSVFAQWAPQLPVWPSVYNNGTYVQVIANNPNTMSVWCTGNLSMSMDDGSNSNYFVSLNIFPHGFESRNYYPVNMGSGVHHITNVNHSIFCR